MSYRMGTPLFMGIHVILPLFFSMLTRAHIFILHNAHTYIHYCTVAKIQHVPTHIHEHQFHPHIICEKSTHHFRRRILHTPLLDFQKKTVGAHQIVDIHTFAVVVEKRQEFRRTVHAEAELKVETECSYHIDTHQVVHRNPFSNPSP